MPADTENLAVTVKQQKEITMSKDELRELEM